MIWDEAVRSMKQGNFINRPFWISSLLFMYEDEIWVCNTLNLQQIAPWATFGSYHWQMKTDDWRVSNEGSPAISDLAKIIREKFSSVSAMKKDMIPDAGEFERRSRKKTDDNLRSVFG